MKDMPELARIILSAVRSSDEWQTRGDIARAIGRPRNLLTAHDIGYLDRLTEDGLIEKREATRGVALKRFEYRPIKESEE